jgi:hypothetical protein
MFAAFWLAVGALRLAEPSAIADEPQGCSWRFSEVITFYFGVEVDLPDPDHPETMSEFHTDISTPWSDCGWDIYISEDRPTGEEITDPNDALLYAGESARVILDPIPSGFEFIGATPGVPFWVLPQNYQSGVLWLGFCSGVMTSEEVNSLCEWNPEDPRGGADVPARWLRVQLVDVRAPAGGDFSMWQTGGSGQVDAYWSTFEGGLTEQDVYHYQAGSHTHQNWGLTQAGLYEVDIQVGTFTIFPRGDADCNSDVDLADYAELPDCLAGPAVLPNPLPPVLPTDCLNWFDFDRDEDVDLFDFAAFQDALADY